MSVCIYRVEHVDSSVYGIYYSKELTLVRGGHGKPSWGRWVKGTWMSWDANGGTTSSLLMISFLESINFILAIRELKYENSCFH